METTTAPEGIPNAVMYERVPPQFTGIPAQPTHFGLLIGGREVREGDTILTDPHTGQGLAVAPDQLAAEFRQPNTSAQHARLEADVAALRVQLEQLRAEVQRANGSLIVTPTSPPSEPTTDTTDTTPADTPAG